MNTGVNALGAVDGASFEEAKHKLVFYVFDAVGDDNIEVPHRERKVIAEDQTQNSNLARGESLDTLGANRTLPFVVSLSSHE
jgi:hypothetical protein